MNVSDYAAIGDCRTIALISKHGAVDWLCLPKPSSTSFFGALLDADAGGTLAVRPKEVLSIDRGYIGSTNVLNTRFQCRGGALTVTDFIRLAPSDEQRDSLRAEHELIRLLECTEGKVNLEIIYRPRPGYARDVPRLIDRGRLGWMCQRGGLAAFLQTDIELGLLADATLCGRVTLQAGEQRQLVFSACENDANVLLPLGNETTRALETTLEWWRNWSQQCSYRGAYRSEVIRSCLALKLLTFSLSGAVLAAATTSLPVASTGERNWDYRYCWLRDSSMVLRAFLQLGFRAESHAFLSWLLHATALTQPRLQVMYDVYGRTGLKERELKHLRGHAGIGPVRIGNGAHSQSQLDIYGEVVCAAAAYSRAGGVLDTTERKLLAGLGNTVCALWREPDQGIWEVRSEPRHHTYSKVMCWVALDQLLQLHRDLPFDADVRAWHHERQRIREDVETNGFDANLNAYVAYYGSKQPDASLMLLARYGYVEPRDPRMLGTCAFIESQLSVNGLLYRYPAEQGSDGLGGSEGFFALCSFWLVEYLSAAGERGRATELFERLLRLANDVGLYAEEFDSEDGSLRGNFPQAFTHLGLITAALALDRSAAQEGDERGNGRLDAA
jgi:GH15 family glucan-1,4-alpha-glucosidase